MLVSSPIVEGSDVARGKVPELVSLREAAQMWGVPYSSMVALPSRYPPGHRRAFPAWTGSLNDQREKLYPGPEVKAWLDGRPGRQGRPQINPPDYLSEGAWTTLVRIADHGAHQQRPDRWRGNHDIVTDGGATLDMRVVGPLVAEGLVRAVGKRGGIRYVVTADGRRLLDDPANQAWLTKARATA